MRKIKPIAKKHRFLRWIKRLLGVKSPSEEWLRGPKNIDEMHELKAVTKFYCNGKKGFCDRDRDCEEHDEMGHCEFFDSTGGDFVIVQEDESHEPTA